MRVAAPAQEYEVSWSLPDGRKNAAVGAVAGLVAGVLPVLAHLGSIELDPDIRKSGDSGHPIVMEGDQSPHAKSIYAFVHRVIERTREVQAAAGDSVIEIR